MSDVDVELDPDELAEGGEGEKKQITQRAARKAAAACLARQRHKSFVTSLQDQVNSRKARVSALRGWHDEVFAVTGASMVSQLDGTLSAQQMAQLRRWLLRSPRLTAILNGDECPSSASSATEETHSASVAPTPPHPELGGKCPRKPSEPEKEEAPPVRVGQTMALDEELSKQVFVTEAAVAAGVMLQEAEAALAAGEVTVEEVDDEEELAVLHSMELQETYGDGLSSLLQHLVQSGQQSSVQAWLQLKGEVERSNDPDAAWTNLAKLEEDFMLMNNEHHGSALALAR